MNTLFTIGHSNHEIGTLVELMRRHAVQAVADVRSQPYSARFPQFSQPVLKREPKQLVEQAYDEQGDKIAFRQANWVSEEELQPTGRT